MSTIRFAIVGFGYIGRRHAEIIKGHPDCELVAVGEIEPDKAGWDDWMRIGADEQVPEPTRKRTRQERRIGWDRAQGGRLSTVDISDKAPIDEHQRNLFQILGGRYELMFFDKEGDFGSETIQRRYSTRYGARMAHRAMLARLRKGNQ